MKGSPIIKSSIGLLDGDTAIFQAEIESTDMVFLIILCMRLVPGSALR